MPHGDNDFMLKFALCSTETTQQKNLIPTYIVELSIGA